MTKVTDFLVYIREMAGPPCASCHFYACPKQTFLCMLTKWTIIGNNFLISSSFSLRIVFGWEIFTYLFTFFFPFFFCWRKMPPCPIDKWISLLFEIKTDTGLEWESVDQETMSQPRIVWSYKTNMIAYTTLDCPAATLHCHNIFHEKAGQDIENHWNHLHKMDMSYILTLRRKTLYLIIL